MVFAIFLLVLFACAGPVHKADPKELSKVETILVLPFYHIDDMDAEPVIIDCKLCRQRHTFEFVAAGDAVFMYRHLMALLHSKGTYQYLFHDQAKDVSYNLNFDNLAPSEFKKRIVTSKISQDIDAVLMGYIFRFRGRVGTRYAIESPSSVAFSLYLISMDDGQVIWHSRYKETQEALFSNLLTFGKFLKRKARWVTARELASEALKDMLSTLEKP